MLPMLIKENMCRLLFILLMMVATTSVYSSEKVKFQIDRDGEFIKLLLINIHYDSLLIVRDFLIGNLQRESNTRFTVVSCDGKEYPFRAFVKFPEFNPGTVIEFESGMIIGQLYRVKRLISSHGLKPGCYLVKGTYQNQLPKEYKVFDERIYSNELKLIVENEDISKQEK